MSAIQQRVLTDQDGAFTLEVPLGTYNISVRFPFYLTQTVSGIEVTKSQPKQTLRVILTPQVIKLGPIHLPVRLSESSETGLLEKRRLSFAVEDSISTELMAKLPVSDAGEALKRVTGISIVGGRYVFVRGLGERYSNTLLNSVQIPSPEPNRRVVPMDIFPANLLESLQTVKTFSPDQPGNFAGGSVQVFTKDFPDAFTMSLSMSSSFNTGTTGNELLEYPGGAFDRFGFDDGTRALPDIIAGQPPDVPIRERGRFTQDGFTPEEIQEFGQAFDNVWSPERYTAPANQGYKFSIGNSSKLVGKDWGYLGIISYSNGHSHRPEEEQNAFRLGLDELTPVTKYIVERSTNDVSWGVLNTSMRFSPGHKVSLRTLYSHTAEDETLTREGFNADRDTDMRSSRLLYVEPGLLSSQIAGDHEFDFASENLNGNSESEAVEESETSEPEFTPVPTLSWRLTFSRATRNEPDKHRSRPRVAKPQLQQIATTSARLPIGSERFTIPASSLSVGAIDEPSTQLGRGLAAGARQAQVVDVTPQFEAPRFMSTSMTGKIDTGNNFAQMDFNPEAMEPITTELRDATQSFTEFLQSIREKIKRSQRYPRSVRNLADGSEAQVQFTIRRDGSLIDAKVVASSGSKSLDAAALSAVRDAAPFPSFPEGQEGSTLRLEIPIAFQLKTN